MKGLSHHQQPRKALMLCLSVVCVCEESEHHRQLPPNIPPPKEETPGKVGRGEAELTDGERDMTKQKDGYKKAGGRGKKKEGGV